MCGIAGFSGPSQPDVLDKMLVALNHRGPDDRGRAELAGMSLGMTRLSIVDIEGGRQPMRDGYLSLVFNGEIYNYRELRDSLEKRGHRFSTASDTETVLRAYAAYGPRFLDELDGMFALAIWDDEKKELLLARDRMGEKPLFYSCRENRIVFASEIKAVRAHPSVSRTLSPESLSHFLSLRHVPSPLTIYDDIRALPPGHWLRFRDGRVETARWYNLPAAPVAVSEEDAIARLDELLNQSVNLRLRADVEVGAYLSGGLDSSLIVALMSRHGARPPKTFSLGYRSPVAHKQDATYARQVSDRFGCEHHVLEMTPEAFRADLPAVFAALDQPFAGVLASFWLTRLISRHVKVALSGDGADDLFASYGHHRLVAAIQNFQGAVRNRRDPATVNYGFFDDRRDFVRKLAELPPWEWRLAYAAFLPQEKTQLLSARGREWLTEYDTAEHLRAIYEDCPAGVGPLSRMLRLDQRTLLPDEILYYADLLSMAHSVEVRMPFLDPAIVGFASSLPDELKISGNTLKYILRKVAGNYLPAEILERPKEGFVLPMNTWLRDELCDLTDVLSEGALAEHGLFDPAFVTSLLARFRAGDDTLTFRVWTLIAFQMWYGENA